MKNSQRFLLALVLTAAVRLAAASADADFKALNDAVAAKQPAELTSGSTQFHWREKQANLINDLAEKFMADHPADPRRWEAALILFAKPRVFVKSFDDALLDQQRPGTVVRGAVTYDTEARVRHGQRLAALDEQCYAATDMTPEVRRKYLLGRISRKLREATTAVLQKKSVDIPAVHAEVDNVIAAYPDAPETGTAFELYVNLIRRQGATPEQVLAFLQTYATSPSEAVRATAEVGLTLKKAQEKPLDWKFTAADGREVDLAKLRGRVVLIDFWATWCHPCVEEIPNVLANYQKYHDQGFEVVGMTLENAGVTPAMSQEQAAAKLAAARAKLLAFTRGKGMPWPQYFDGTGWKNPYTTKYGIHGIPRMFLLDQEGKVVTMDARGPKLESEIKRLLKP